MLIVCNFPGMARKIIERDRWKKKMREGWKNERERERGKKKNEREMKKRERGRGGKKKKLILDHYYREKMQGHHYGNLPKLPLERYVMWNVFW